jgi:hypothetical protein
MELVLCLAHRLRLRRRKTVGGLTGFVLGGLSGMKEGR